MFLSEERRKGDESRRAEDVNGLDDVRILDWAIIAGAQKAFYSS